jgi:hypothetical protein
MLTIPYRICEAMKILKEIYDIPWEFTLYETDQGFLLNVDFCNSAVDFSRSYKLLEREIGYSSSEIKALADKIRKDSESFKDREITPAITK